MRIAGGVLLIICSIVMLIAGVDILQKNPWAVLFGANQPFTIGLIALILAVLAVVGAVFAIMGKHIKYAIGGAVCAVASTFVGLYPMVIFSIPALIFILYQHRAFE